MRIEQLEYLAAVTEHGSLRRASEAMHISQPALSEAVTKLEKELGTTLLDRGRTGSRISRQGLDLLQNMTEVLEAVDRLRQAAGQQSARRRDLRIGTVVTASAPPDLVTHEPSPVHDIAFADGARSGTDWSSIVADAVKRITGGELDKVVLARDLIAIAEQPIDLRWPLRQLASAYPNCWTFSVDGLIGATPELLVRREKGLITSRVLAGTIRRTGDDAHDLALAASLARSSKDLEEHEFAVRSVADALEPHCTSMNVPETPFVLHLPNVMHLATDVAGVAANGASALGLAAALHPSAAVCGTPTDLARDLIGEIEGMRRGRFSGPVGWMDAAGDGEWCIALRCGQADPDDPRRMRLFAGAGIVAGSDPVAELAETNAKLVPMRDALGD